MYNQSDKQNIRYLMEIKAGQVKAMLMENIADIPDTNKWAEMAGISRKGLNILMKKVYTKTPKLILRELKYEQIIQLIEKQGLNAGSFAVAIDAGFRNHEALSKFLIRHYGTNFTRLKVEVLKNHKHLIISKLDDNHK